MDPTFHTDKWSFRQARDIRTRDRYILLVLITAGLFSIGFFGEWWFRAEHVQSPYLFVPFSLIFWYGILRMILMWINYLAIRKPVEMKSDGSMSVAIFTTSSPGEPLSMFDKTLAACKMISYPHTTYLLDDTQDPGFKALAEKHSAIWLELVGLPGAKAGKVNKALELTKEDIVLILDPDHIPFPNFLDEVLGYFRDPKVGFVQVGQAYYNEYRSFTAKGAAEQTYNFYGPTMMGLFGLGTNLAIGANCTFRRHALESIGGHGIGLAEDMVTAIRLHAAGWKSIYLPKIVSRGLVPEDFGSFCKQQLKWSRGVHEVLFAEFPRLFRKLTGWQRLSYATIATYYLTGATTFFYILIPYLYFYTGIMPANMAFDEFIIYGLPFAMISIAIYLFMQRWLCHPEMERGLHWRGTILKFSCWPVYFLGFLLSLIQAKVPYIPTAKKAVGGKLSAFARPLILQFLLFWLTIGIVSYQRLYLIPEGSLPLTSEQTWGMAAFALLATLMVSGGILAAWQSRSIKPKDTWEGVPLHSLQEQS